MQYDNGAPKQFRYTQRQRRKEQKIDQHAERVLEKRNAATVDGQSIAAWELQLSAHNFKTVSYAAFRACIQAKLLVFAKVAPFYRDRFFRKNRLNAYFDNGASERKMLAAMADTFGPPERVVIGIGDWEQKRQAADQREGLPRPASPRGLSRLPRGRIPYESAVLVVPARRRPVHALQEAVRAHRPGAPAHVRPTATAGRGIWPRRALPLPRTSAVPTVQEGVES